MVSKNNAENVMKRSPFNPMYLNSLIPDHSESDCEFLLFHPSHSLYLKLSSTLWHVVDIQLKPVLCWPSIWRASSHLTAWSYGQIQTQFQRSEPNWVHNNLEALLSFCWVPIHLDSMTGGKRKPGVIEKEHSWASNPRIFSIGKPVHSLTTNAGYHFI